MKKVLSTLFLSGLLAASAPADAKVVHLLPRPQSVTPTAGAASFVLNRPVNLTDDSENAALRNFLKEVGCTVDATASAKVTVTLVNAIEEVYDYELKGFPNEGYLLEITADAVNITAVTEIGVTRAAQTLAQLAQGYEGTPELEALTMKDWPAFKVRGFMHDVGRSFISVERIKEQIDLLARFKVNLFHWHFTENQAWRFEVKKYPQLTSAASMTRFAGEYYTQEQCKEVQEYAAERGITIIPEIDMPGHSQAFIRAMGHDMQTNQGVEELQYILEEVAEVFDKSTYIHIGGDEVAITYPNFLQTMIAKVKSLGKEAMLWNPISGVNVAGLDAAMTQMWSSSGKKIAGKANLDCRYNYTNHFDVFADLVGIYKSNIYYQQQGSAEVPGFISCPWNDRKTATEEDIFRQNNIYANTIASAERAWIGGGKQYIETGGTTLPNSGDEYDEFADWERRFLFHKETTLSSVSDLIPYVKQTNVRWRITDAFPNGNNASAVLPPETEGLKDSYVYNGVTYGSGMATGAGIYLRHTWGSTIPTYFTSPQTGTTAYAWTYVYSPKEQTVGALIEFQNYGRSERDMAPEKGKWDRKGSRLWVNDEEILPPTWDNTGVSISSGNFNDFEKLLKNENFSARKPEQIKLNQGWNKVFMKLPYVAANGVRLNKWMFTFVLTDLDGTKAIEDLIYSPNQCMDAAAEQVAATITEIKKRRNSVIGTTPGYYPESTAAELDKVLAEIEKTLSEEMTEAAREDQIAVLQEALNNFNKALEEAGLIQPKASTATNVQPYHMYTPLRGSRYPTSKGVGKAIIGETVPVAASQWKFVSRTDGTFDIVNMADDSYISPESSNNTALKTSATQPSKGWTLKPADEVGYFIITCGTVQFNQTNSGQSFQLYNWGDGTNITDTGCKYRIVETEIPEPVEQPVPVLTLTNLEFDGATEPYRIPDEYAQPLLEATTLTAVIDYTQSTSSAVTSLLATTNTNSAASFLAIVTMDGNRYGVRYGDNGEWYTQNSTVTGSHKMAIVMTESAGLKYYLDGSFGRDVSVPGNQPTFYNVPDRDAMYIGGLVTADNENKYPFTGTIRSVRIYTEALTGEQIAALEYDNLVPTAISSACSEGGVKLVGNRIVCNGKFKVYTSDGREVSPAVGGNTGVYFVKHAGGTAKIIVK